MHCPKCNFDQNPGNTECERCGVIFAKFRAAAHNNTRKDGSPEISFPSNDTNGSISFSDILFTARPDDNRIYFYGRLAILIFLAGWAVRFITSPIASNYPGNSFMHLVNLPFHEAGHIVFRPFGALITSLGGTIGQLLMPLICLSVFLFKTRDPFGASVALWWFGQNLFDISPYVNDARSLSLPLVGGNFGYSSPYGFHDWEYILTETGLLQYDHFLAKSCVVIGTLIFMASILWGGFVLYVQWRRRANR